VVRQKWFQHIQSVKMQDFKTKLNEIFTVLIKVFATFGGIMLVFFMFKDTPKQSDDIRQYNKTKDSLEGIIQKYKEDYKLLEKRANHLDSIIKVKAYNVKIVKERFYIYRDREIKNPTEATRYIQKFIQE
jgi:hypothetical protein